MFTFWSVCTKGYKWNEAITVVNPENALTLSWHLLSSTADMENGSCLPREGRRVQRWSVRPRELLYLPGSLMHPGWTEPGLWNWPAPGVSSKGQRRVAWASEQSHVPVLPYVRRGSPALQADTYCEAQIFVSHTCFRLEFLTIIAALHSFPLALLLAISTL